MNKRHFFVVSSLILILTGCVNSQAHLNFRLWKLHCVKQFRECNKICKDSNQNCNGKANFLSKQHYKLFVQQQSVQGGIIARDLSSYRDPIQCYKATCDCSADYYQCIQAHKGTIQQYFRVKPTCC